MSPVQRRPLLAVSILTVSSLLASCAPILPWVFNAPRAAGYSIDLVDARPVPGTPLAAGESVDFVVRVKYSLSIASHGWVILVFEDDRDNSAKQGQQAFQRVASPGGAVTLRDRVTVPAHAKELRLFVPLRPDGVDRTTGEVTIRYPIKQN